MKYEGYQNIEMKNILFSFCRKIGMQRLSLNVKVIQST